MKNRKSAAKDDNGEIPAGAKFLSRLFHLAGEVEIIFALWLIPLFAGFWIYFGWDSLTAYVDWLTFEKKKFIEPVFVVFVMCVSATRPIIQFSEDVISVFAKLFAKLGGGELRGWWMAILCVGSLLGSFITEPAAITICAVLLAKNSTHGSLAKILNMLHWDCFLPQFPQEGRSRTSRRPPC